MSDLKKKLDSGWAWTKF